METGFYIVVSLGVFMGVCSIIGIRTKWLGQELFDLINKDGVEAYRELPNFWVMTAKFWIWDVNDFKPAEVK